MKFKIGYLADNKKARKVMEIYGKNEKDAISKANAILYSQDKEELNNRKGEIKP